MMENFAHILQLLPIATCTSSSRIFFGGTSPFKVQVNFDIPIFEGQIDENALEKWLKIFPIGKISPSHSSRISPMSNIGGKCTRRKFPQRNLEYVGSGPLGIFLWMQSKKSTILLITMKTST
jgi:hypothetical protein